MYFNFHLVSSWLKDTFDLHRPLLSGSDTRISSVSFAMSSPTARTLLLAVFCLLCCSKPCVAPAPQGVPLVETIAAPLIGGLAEEALALVNALDPSIDPTHQVVFVAPDASVTTVQLSSPLPSIAPNDSNRRRRFSAALQQLSTNATAGKSSSSSSSSSASSVNSSKVAAAQAALTAPPEEDLDPVPQVELIDGHSRVAAQTDQRTVYLWTFSHTDKEGNLTLGRQTIL